jgi:signal transduction histidine kinase/PAS domain-containing protein
VDRPEGDLLHEAMAGSGMHAWAIDLRTGVIEVAEGALERTGMPMQFSTALGRERVHIDDRSALNEAVAEALAGNGRFVVDHRFVHPDTGEIVWYRERGVVERDAEGTAVRIVGTSLDITEHKLAEHMQELSSHLIVEDDISAVHERILDVAMAMLSSDFASLQLYVPERAELRLIHSRNISPEAIAHWTWIDAKSGSVCGKALRTGCRVIVADVDTLPADVLPMHYQEGIRSVQSTPLIARDGRLIGMLATHWRRPHVPSERELRLFDVLVRQAADLMERSQAAEALRESEARFRTVFESMDEGFYLGEVIFDADGVARDIKMIEENPAAIRLVGRSLVGGTFRDAFPEASERWYEVYGRVARTGVGERLEIQAKAIGRWLDAWIFRPEPNVVSSPRVASVWHDVTERRRTAHRDAFRVRLADALRPLADTLDIQATALRTLGVHLGASRVVYAAVSASGVSCEVQVNYRADGIASLVGAHSMGEFFRSTLATGATMVVHDAISTPGPTKLELAAYRRGQLGAHITVPLVKGGRLTGFMSVHSEQPRTWTDDEIALVVEIAEQTWAAVERAMAEAEVRHARDELERRVALRTEELARTNAELRAEMAERQRLQRQLVTAQENERRRVARDLHDQTGQLLAGLALAVRGVSGAPDQLSELQRIADELAAQVHALAVQLRPTALDDLGLVPALRQLIDDWSLRTGMPVDFETATLDRRLPPEIETVLYRVVQEALTNTCKHANASAVSVITSWLDDHASAIVEDNGCGFDPLAPMPDRLGLLGMRERVALAGGELVVESAPNRGTTVIARIPLR